MLKLYEYIKMKLFYLGYLEHPWIANLFYVIDSEVEQLRDLQDIVEKIREQNKELRADNVRLINLILAQMDTTARIAFMELTAGIPTVPKQILKAAYIRYMCFIEKSRCYGSDSGILDKLSARASRRIPEK